MWYDKKDSFVPSEYDIKLLKAIRKYSKKSGSASSACIIKKFGNQSISELSKLRFNGYVKSPSGPDPWKSYIDDSWSLTDDGLICLDNNAIIRDKLVRSYVLGIISGALVEAFALILTGALQLT